MNNGMVIIMCFGIGFLTAFVPYRVFLIPHLEKQIKQSNRLLFEQTQSTLTIIEQKDECQLSLAEQKANTTAFLEGLNKVMATALDQAEAAVAKHTK